jgi:hypothetical protein
MKWEKYIKIDLRINEFLFFFIFSSRIHGTFVSLPPAISKEFISIKHLVIDHSCTLSKLNTIFSYAPQLRCFSCKDLWRSYQDIKKIVPITLSNLTNIVLVKCSLTFDEFQMFMTTISPKVQLLRVVSSDMYRA